MELWLALTLRDLGFLLYGGPMVAFTVVIALAGRVPGIDQVSAVRAYRTWGPGFGLALGATIFGGLAARWLEQGGFSWAWDTPAAQVDLGLSLAFLVLWVSNIKLEIWTLQPLRTLDDPTAGVVDGDAYTHATASLVRHMVVHAALVLAVFVLAQLNGTPIPI